MPGVAVKYSGVLNGIGAAPPPPLGPASAACSALNAPAGRWPAVNKLAYSIQVGPRNPLASPLLCPPSPDTTFWDPAVDPHLPACYTPQQQEGKALCKRYLQQASAAGVARSTAVRLRWW